MRYLVDTNVALWIMQDDGRVGSNAITALQDAELRLVSVASVWEIAIKVQLGKLDAPDNLLAALDDSGLELLDVTASHALIAGALPLHHKDPFDRMLVAQAQVEGLTLVTADRALGAYDVSLLDARL